MSTVPQTMRAWVEEKDKKVAALKEVSVPKPDSNDVLVKVHYAAQNPTDYKHMDMFSPPGALLGLDFSGEVVQLGSAPQNSSLKVGDRVAGIVHGGLYPDKGAYAEYVKAQSEMVWKVPDGFEMADAATFGVPWFTACQALIHDQHKSWPPAKADEEWFLVYGASSAVGLFAVQLAKAMGYKVIAVCGEHNFDLVKRYGAAETLSYKDQAKCIEEVKRISGGGVAIGLDTISEGDSYKTAIGSFGPKGGRLNCILWPSEEVKNMRKDVEVSFTLMYWFFGKEFNMDPTNAIPQDMSYPAKPDEHAFGVEAVQHTAEMITKFGIKANPVKLRGGLEAVLDGFDDMRQGKISAQKLVYKIA